MHIHSSKAVNRVQYCSQFRSGIVREVCCSEFASAEKDGIVPNARAFPGNRIYLALTVLERRRVARLVLQNRHATKCSQFRGVERAVPPLKMIFCLIGPDHA
jgi:hypothetical protein